MKTRLLAGVALAALLALTASLRAPRPSDGATPERRIGIEHFTFLPPAMTVQAGTKVTWVNRDEETHTVTSAAGAFASPALEKGETFSYTFTAPGAYSYFCALHPYMKSTLTVQ
ncbi:MAG: amidase [Candidatus Rokuibacteriota bacterium]|nr:MAG: amidase [Candidatus Rokubacteria bacterium]